MAVDSTVPGRAAFHPPLLPFAGADQLLVAAAPVLHGVHDGLERPAELGEAVLHARGHLGIDRALDEAGALQVSGHTMPEGQQAVADKIAYLQKLEEIAGESSTADEFKTAMLEAFPGYSGVNYLEMTAGYLFPEA